MDPGQYQFTQNNSFSAIGVKTGPQSVFASKTAKGESWLNNSNAPFTKSTALTNPGPGKYGSKKKKEDLKTKILQEETIKVPFNTGDVRACNKKKPEDSMPGPG